MSETIALSVPVWCSGEVNSRAFDRPPLTEVVYWVNELNLRVLLTQPSLDLDALYNGCTAQEIACDRGCSHLAEIIEDEVCPCVRWLAPTLLVVLATTTHVFSRIQAGYREDTRTRTLSLRLPIPPSPLFPSLSFELFAEDPSSRVGK